MPLRHWPAFITLLTALFATTPVALAQQVLKLSTTTSTENSGLLNYLLPLFDASSHTRHLTMNCSAGPAGELYRFS